MRYLFILGFFMIVVGIPVIAGLIRDMHKRQMKLRERELELTSAHTAEKAAQYAAQTERLEQRVRVLERIVTDKGLLISDEIEMLRAEPRPQLPPVQ
jgi:hypothetical protein